MFLYSNDSNVKLINLFFSRFYWTISILCILIICCLMWCYWNTRRRRRNREQINAINNYYTPPTFYYQRQIWNNIPDIDNFLYRSNTTQNLNNQQSNTNIAASAPEPLINNDQPSSSNNETDNICNICFIQKQL